MSIWTAVYKLFCAVMVLACLILSTLVVLVLGRYDMAAYLVALAVFSNIEGRDK